MPTLCSGGRCYSSLSKAVHCESILEKIVWNKETHEELPLNVRLTLQDWGKLDWEVLIGRDLLPILLIHQRMSA